MVMPPSSAVLLPVSSRTPTPEFESVAAPTFGPCWMLELIVSVVAVVPLTAMRPSTVSRVSEPLIVLFCAWLWMAAG